MIDIEKMLTLDEKSNMDFLLSLRKRWADFVYPALAAEYVGSSQKAKDVSEAESLLETMHLYPWFSHIERCQQKLLWKSAGDAVVSRKAKLLEQMSNLPANPKGKLIVDDNIELPSWYTAYDIHVQPGSFYSDELSAYVYELGARIVMLRENDGYKFHDLFVKTALPDNSSATRIVDVGCGFGKSTRPLCQKYPSAEIIGFDLAAPGLRLAHAEAENYGIGITYINADARNTGIDSNSCDVVTGTMVLHEMPSHAIVETIQEAARMLKPGGEMHFLEFNKTGDLFRDATIYQHAERNNEPYFRDLFATDLVVAAEESGLINARWSSFDERSEGLQPEGWGKRTEWHFPWAVFSAWKPEE